MYSPGKNTGVSCHFLLQGIFPTQGSNPGFLHCRWIFFFFFFLPSEQPGSPLYEHERKKLNQWRMEGVQWQSRDKFRSSGFLGLTENVESPCSGNAWFHYWGNTQFTGNAHRTIPLNNATYLKTVRLELKDSIILSSLTGLFVCMMWAFVIIVQGIIFT